MCTFDPFIPHPKGESPCCIEALIKYSNGVIIIYYYRYKLYLATFEIKKVWSFIFFPFFLQYTRSFSFYNFFFFQLLFLNGFLNYVSAFKVQTHKCQKNTLSKVTWDFKNKIHRTNAYTFIYNPNCTHLFFFFNF